MIRFYNPLAGYSPPNLNSLFGAERTGHTHNGWDENASIGTPVRASAQGRVAQSEDAGGAAGNAVTLSHGQGWTSFYCHLYSLNCVVGQTVTEGQIIGTVGETGNAETPHLHVEWRLYGQPVDPKLILQPECSMSVQWVQTRLKAHHCDPGLVDGWFGPQTGRAVSAFQTIWKLPPTGTVDTLTVLALKGKPKPLPKHAPDVERWRSLVEKYWTDTAQPIDYVLTVLWAESAGQPNAVNPRSQASGLFQHLPQYWEYRSVEAGWSGADIFDPEANIAVAAWLWGEQGWGAWEATLVYPLERWSSDWRWLGDRYGIP